MKRSSNTRKNRKRTGTARRLAALALTLCLLLPALGGCGAARRPLNYLKHAVEKTLENRFGGGLFDVLDELKDGGSLRLTFGGADEYDGRIGAADVTVYLDAAEHRAAMLGSLTAGGETFEGRLYADGDRIVADSPSFFGSTTLGIDLGTLSADLSNSVFRNDSGTAYAQPNVGDGAADAANGFAGGVFDLCEFFEGLPELADDRAEDFLKALTETDPARMNTYREGGLLHVEAEVTNDTLSRALRTAYVRAVKNRSFCRKVRAAAAASDRVASAQAGVTITENRDRAERFLTNGDTVEELCAKIDAAHAFRLTVGATVRRLTGLAETLTVTYESEHETTDNFTFSADFSEKDAFSLSLTMGGAVREFSWRTEKKTLRAFTGVFSYFHKDPNAGSVFETTGDLSLNRKTDVFTLTLLHNGGTRVLTGEWRQKGHSASLSFTGITVDGVAGRLSLSLTLDAGAKMPEVPEYVNLALIREDRLDPIAARARETRARFEAAVSREDVAPARLCRALLGTLGAAELAPEPPTETAEP